MNSDGFLIVITPNKNKGVVWASYTKLWKRVYFALMVLIGANFGIGVKLNDFRESAKK